MLNNYLRYCVPAALSLALLTCAVQARAQLPQLPLPLPSCDPKVQSCGPGTPPPPDGGGGMCRPSPGGSTCSAPEPASQGQGQGINVGAGNPMNIITGNKYQRETDLPALPGVLGLEIVRHYNSVYSSPTHPNGIMGRGWKLSYETELYHTGRSVQIVQADGARVIFNVDLDDPSRCASGNPDDGTIQIRKGPAGAEYTWRWANRRELIFNGSGKLVRIVAPIGEAVLLEYTSKGLLSQVTDPQGRVLRLNYFDREYAKSRNAFSGVQSIDSPVGRFGYEYGSPAPQGSSIAPALLLPNLVKVTLPAAGPVTASGTAARLYHYEDARHPTLLTGISVVGQGTSAQSQTQRTGTYLYGTDGKGILTVKGIPARLQTGPDGKAVVPARLVPGSGVEQVVFDRSIGGQTTITNGLGQKTVYRYAVIGGAYRLLEVRGVGCASCGMTNVRYGYDRLGRLTDTTYLGVQGDPIRTVGAQRDANGRVVQMSEVQYRQGKPGPAQWQLRYAYKGAEIQPSSIARTSAVAGKESVLRIAKNDKGQLLSVTENGWAPALSGKGPATPLARTATYGYRVINGKSLLSWVDGPLPNGKTNSPADSDIRQYEYDPQGRFVSKIIAPGNITTTIAEYDAAGHPALVETSDGIHPAIRTLTTYNNQGQPVRIAEILNRETGVKHGSAEWLRRLGTWFGFGAAARAGGDGLVTSIDYDAQARPSRVTEADATYTEALYDPSGGLARVRDQDGNAITNIYDTENNLLTTTEQSSSSRAPLEVVTTYHYDALNRVEWVREPSGAVTRYAYDTRTGKVASRADSLKRRTDFAFDDLGQSADVLLASADQNARILLVSQRRYPERDVVIAGNGAATQRLRDDFGRVLMIVSPDSGTQFAQYDAADRPTLSIDGNGNRTSFLYNAAGALVERTTTGKASDGRNAEERVTYRYEGAQLRAISNAHQRTEYAYDRNGRVVEQVDLITPVEDQARGRGAAAGNRQPLRFVKRFTYDSVGRVSTRTMASGETLMMSYDKSGLPHKIELRSADGETVQPIATDIEQQRLTGLVGFKHGNGVSTRYVWDKQTGQLKQLLVAPNLMSSADASNANASWSFIPEAHAATEPAGAQQAEPLYAQAIDYDIAGRITRIVRSGSYEGKPAQERYAYDLFNHLSEVETPLQKAVWRYDATGNRIAQTLTLTGSPEQVQHEALQYETGSNRLTRVAGAVTGDQAYKYDAAGAPLQIGPRSYEYGVTRRLERVRQKGSELARYAYNARGERVSKTVSDRQAKASTVYYLYHDRQIDAEIDDDGNLVAQYIYLGHNPIAKLEYSARQIDEPDRKGGAGENLLNAIKGWFGMAKQNQPATRVYAIHSDHLGTPQLATDDRQKIVWQARYATFGNAEITVRVVNLNLRAPGQYFDSETGLHYNYFRDYDPRVGRYVQSDPMGINGGINTYGYVGADPLAAIDLLGLAGIRFGAPRFDTFGEQSKWFRAFNAKYKAMIDANYSMGELIKKNCPSLLPLFDQWVIYVDPNIDNVYNRARSGWGFTNYSKKTTQFNYAFFNLEPGDPDNYEIFAHEFRHLMYENFQIPRNMGGVILGTGSKDDQNEMDADRWAKNFWQGKCECKK